MSRKRGWRRRSNSTRGGPLVVEKPAPNPNAIREVVRMILEAERPVLMPGGGAIIADASGELVELAEYLQVPVSPTYMGKGVIPEDHPLYMGVVGIQTNQCYANALFLESDLVVGIGNRWAERHTGDLDVYRGERRFVHVPIKLQRVFQEMNEFFDEDTIFVTAIGLYQIWSGQFQKTYKPRHYLCCGQAGPLGWEVPACIGAKLGRSGNLVVGVVGDYSFGFLMEEIAVALQYGIPYVLVMVNNGYMSLIRQPEKYQYEMDSGVDIFYEGLNDSVGMNHVGVMEAMGALGRKARHPEDIRPALEWAVRESEERRVPALVEVLVERDTDAAMGLSIDNINEFEPTEDRTGAMVGGIPQRD
jgi:glyoxylate carboligase